MAGSFIGLTKQSNDGKIDGIGGQPPTTPIGETSIFYNEALDGVPRNDNLFATRVLGQTTQIEWLKDIIKSQVASTDFSVVPDIPEDEDREPSNREIEAAKRIEEFFQGQFNTDNTTVDELHGILLDDILDMNSGVLELVRDEQGFLDQMIPRDGLTFTINQKTTGLLPEPDSDDPAYFQFSLSAHAEQYLNHDRRGIDINGLRDQFSNLPFTRIFNREQKEFSRDQIVWFQEPQNTKSYTPYGVGRTQKVKNAAEIMINGDMHRNRFFLDNEFHKGLLAVDSQMSQDDKQRLQDRFHGSAGNEYELPIVGSSESIDYISIDPEPEKMQFLESQKWYTKLVLRAYGLNDAEAGMLENANKGISDNAKFQIFRRTTNPILTMFENRWNRQVLPFMREYHAVDGNVKFVYEPENRFLEEWENSIIDQELDSGVLTINEARERKGREPFGPVGDLPKTAFEKLANSVPDYVAENLNDELDDVPSGGSGAENPFSLNIQNDNSDSGDSKTITEINDGSSSSTNNNKEEDGGGDDSGSTTPSANNITNYREAFQNKEQVLEQTKDALRNEQGFNDVPGIVKHKEEMKQDVAQVFKSTIQLDQALEKEFPEENQEQGILIDADKIINQINMRDRLGSTLETNNLTSLEMSAEHHEQSIEEETEERLTLPEEAKVEISFDVMDTFTADIIRNEALSAATEIEDSIKDRLKNEILTGASKGESISKIKDRIQDTVDNISSDHAELVARTETLSSSRKGSQALAEATDLVAGKEWLSTDDSRTREWHRVMDGETVPKNDVFTVPKTGDNDQPSDYPRTARVVGEDQPFNCRCSQAPVLQEDMPGGVNEVQELDGVNIDLGITTRQYEVWKQHGQDYESFEQFWDNTTEEMSKSEIAERFEMSKTTVYSWSE